MKKSLLLTLALLGSGLAPAATAATRYVPIAHSYQLVEGAKYAVGAVGTNSNWTAANKGPRFFSRGTDGNVTVAVHSDRTTFDESMLWSMKVHTDRACSNTAANHPHPEQVVSMHQDGNYIVHSETVQGNVVFRNATYSLATANTANHTTEVEFIAVPVLSDFNSSTPLFIMHGGRNANESFYRTTRAVFHDGKFDRYSSTTESSELTIDNDNYTTYFEVYVQVDEADLTPAATALANGEKWDKAVAKANELSDATKKADFIVAYMALPTPTFTDLTYTGIETEIPEKFPAAFAPTETLVEEVKSEILSMYPSANEDDAKINAVKIAAEVAALTGDVKTNTIKHKILGIYATVTPDGTKFYRLISAFDGFVSNQGHMKGIYLDGVNLKWKNLDENDLSFLWVIEPQGNGYTLRNAKTGEYVSRVTADNGNYTLAGFTPSVASIVRNGSTNSVRISNTKAFHCLGHSSGNGASGNLIGWGTSGDGASSWYIQEVSNEEAIRQYYKTALTNYRGTVSEDVSSTINSSESTPVQLVEAYKHLTSTDEFVGKAIKIRSSISEHENLYVGCGSTDAGDKMPMVTIAEGADPSEAIFFYTPGHQLVNVQSQKALNNDMVAAAITGGAAIHITPSTKEGTYFIHGSTYYSHDNSGNGLFDRCSSNPAGDLDEHSFYIELATEEELTQLVGHFTKPELPEDTECEFGDLPGQIVDTWEARKQALIADFSLDGYITLKNESATGIYTVVPASAGHYVRIKATAGNISANSKTGARYLSDTDGSGNRLAFVTTPTDATLFYIASDGYLISERTGRYVGNKGNFISTDYDLPASAEPADHGAQALSIAGPRNTAHAELGAYQILFGTGTRSVHLTATDDGGSANCCSSPCGKAHNFCLETVTSLPVTIQSDGWGSFYCPVPFSVSAQENCSKFYAGKIENGALALTEGESGHVYAGGTALLIKGTAGATINVTLNYGAENADNQFVNALEGTHVAMTHTNAEGKKTFAKTEVAETETAAVYAAAQSDEIVKLSAVGESKPINTLLYTVNADDANIGEDGMLSLNVTQITSGIERVEVRNLDGTVEIYDLQGRRLAAPVHGVNIINGRKVLVK